MREDPVHKSLSNTFRMHQKLNNSYEDGLSGHKGTKSVLKEKSKCHEISYYEISWARCLEIYDLDPVRSHHI